MKNDATARLAAILPKVNDASDAMVNAQAMVWAINFMAQGMSDDTLSSAIMACSVQALASLRTGVDTLEAIASTERAEAGL
ncbi:MAG: hypothetical protein JWQ22_2543 [Devosia sp.]|nr:hypothetical protein [Devosia sp.]